MRLKNKYLLLLLANLFCSQSIPLFRKEDIPPLRQFEFDVKDKNMGIQDGVIIDNYDLKTFQKFDIEPLRFEQIQNSGQNNTVKPTKKFNQIEKPASNLSQTKETKTQNWSVISLPKPDKKNINNTGIKKASKKSSLISYKKQRAQEADVSYVSKSVQQSINSRWNRDFLRTNPYSLSATKSIQPILNNGLYMRTDHLRRQVPRSILLDYQQSQNDELDNNHMELGGSDSLGSGSIKQVANRYYSRDPQYYSIIDNSYTTRSNYRN